MLTQIVLNQAITRALFFFVSDNEDIKKISQTSEDAGTATTNDTPEYAAGLSNKPPTPPPPTPNFPPPQTPASYQAPPTPQSYMSTPPTPLSSFGQSISDAPPLTPNPHRDLTPSATIPSQMTSNLTTYLPVTHQPVNSPRKVRHHVLHYTSCFSYKKLIINNLYF